MSNLYKLLIPMLFLLSSCSEAPTKQIDEHLKGTWEFVLEESQKEVMMFNHNGPVSFYYFSDTLLYFFSRYYKEDTIEHESFECWTENNKIYTQFDDTVQTSIYYKFRNLDSLVLSLEIDFDKSMLYVRRNYPLHDLAKLINATFKEDKP